MDIKGLLKELKEKGVPTGSNYFFDNKYYKDIDYVIHYNLWSEFIDKYDCKSLERDNPVPELYEESFINSKFKHNGVNYDIVIVKSLDGLAIWHKSSIELKSLIEYSKPFKKICMDKSARTNMFAGLMQYYRDNINLLKEDFLRDAWYRDK